MVSPALPLQHLARVRVNGTAVRSSFLQRNVQLVADERAKVGLKIRGDHQPHIKMDYVSFSGDTCYRGGACQCLVETDCVVLQNRWLASVRKGSWRALVRLDSERDGQVLAIGPRQHTLQRGVSGRVDVHQTLLRPDLHSKVRSGKRCLPGTGQIQPDVLLERGCVEAVCRHSAVAGVCERHIGDDGEKVSQRGSAIPFPCQLKLHSEPSAGARRHCAGHLRVVGHNSEVGTLVVPDSDFAVGRPNGLCAERCSLKCDDAACKALSNALRKTVRSVAA
mmetsp:Transcript_7651/g.14494  ORF Transcript_7651/g.14494 Transcript_7651/m.14494 type:complete len:278 (-) Transcript_7651:995-1828(-)